MRALLLTALACLALAPPAGAQIVSPWRQATEQELRALVPEKAPVEQEQIETEFRTAAGVTDGRGGSVFGVVIITAGYAADGKYTHYFRTTATLRLEELKLEPGEYVFGYQRLDAATLRVNFYRARTGELLGAVRARLEKSKGPIRSFYITPPDAGGKSAVNLGRFAFDYALAP